MLRDRKEEEVISTEEHTLPSGGKLILKKVKTDPIVLDPEIIRQFKTSGMILDGWTFTDIFIVDPCDRNPWSDSICPNTGTVMVIQSGLWCSGGCKRFLGRSMRCGCEKYLCAGCLEKLAKKQGIWDELL